MSDLMSARELIIAVLDRERKWPDAPETADAILAAMPEIVRAMVVPLVWVSIAPTFIKCGKYSITHYGGMSIPYKLSIGPSTSYHSTLEEAKAPANAHHVAQLMAGLGLT